MLLILKLTLCQKSAPPILRYLIVLFIDIVQNAVMAPQLLDYATDHPALKLAQCTAGGGWVVRALVSVVFSLEYYQSRTDQRMSYE